ncbi:ParB/RepB/Spo0J family partition protein [Waterburya agarophytonicola K14]|uniref:ParB/RepB/Spo0J family partition protein n=1 Tax=Waterburya agarophytonicola KI4 TaxID=2874699 RepID=A0A964BV39_9CYAN|nr:ParB/RepB/Spo0J family partition protein [Waterburya agarophytonicola]MCC0179197.1 ParB/RepB/Spo0J family partition protein [Waterburya agarophytonicola KI4]
MTQTRKKEQPYTSKLRGVAALLGNAAIEETKIKAAEFIPIDQVKKANLQPRRYFDPIKQEQLNRSVSQHGILEPLLVRPIESNIYEIVAGERRFLAAKAVGLLEIPVVIKKLTDIEAMQIALIENLQRAELNPIEETEGILQLLSIVTELNTDEVVLLLYRMQNESKGKVTQNILGNETTKNVFELFDSLGKLSWESFVTSRLPLLKLPQDILLVLQQGKIEYTKAKIIARIKDETARKQLLEDSVVSSLSLNQIRERVVEAKPKSQKEEIFNRFDNTYKQLKKSKKLLLSNPKKRKKLDSLLTQIENLLSVEK